MILHKFGSVVSKSTNNLLYLLYLLSIVSYRQSQLQHPPMICLLRNSLLLLSLLALTLAASASASGSETVPVDAEEHAFWHVDREDVFFSANTEEPEHSNLRRQLQVMCYPSEPGTKYGDCSGTYSCNCGMCPYCQVSTARGTMCQMSGTSSTFVDATTAAETTCTCTYTSDGKLTQHCHAQTSPGMSVTASPTPAPVTRTFPFSNTNNPRINTSPAPATIKYSLVAPPTHAPLTKTKPPFAAPAGDMNATTDTPPRSPSPSMVPQTTTTTTTPPPSPSPATSAPASLGCHAFFPFNPRICMGTPEFCQAQGVTCESLMNKYSCSCTGAPDITTCSYCQIQTLTEVVCQVAGSSTTIIAVDGSTQTCDCEYGGDSHALLSCSPSATPLSTSGIRRSNGSYSYIVPLP